MAEWWPTHVPGDPAACRALARELHAMAAEIDRVGAAVALKGGPPGWVGTASDRAAGRVTLAATTAECLADRVRRLAGGVDRVGVELAEVEAELAQARARAASDGLVVSPDGFHAPEAHGAVALWRAARDGEARAHHTLSGVLLAVTQGSFAARSATDLRDTLFLVPPVGGDAWEKAAWAVGVPGALASLPTDRFKTRASFVVSTATQSTDPRVARAAGAVEATAPAGKGALKALGAAGNVLTVGLAGREQWRADADHDRLTEAERVGRTAVRAVVEGGATIAGATLLGGFCSPVPGGALVGGAVGGWLGGMAGKAAADVAVEQVDEVIAIANDTAEAVGDAAEAVGEAADAVGEAAEEVGDRLCFWN